MPHPHSLVAPSPTKLLLRLHLASYLPLPSASLLQGFLISLSLRWSHERWGPRAPGSGRPSCELDQRADTPPSHPAEEQF